jgi:hypothetical protein
MEMDALAPNLRPLVRMLAKRPLDPVEVLAERVAEHVRRMARESDRGRQVDYGVAQSTARLCQSLLDRWPDLTGEQRALVQAACLYFVEAGDDEDDLGPGGFDDDLAIAKWVASQL